MKCLDEGVDIPPRETHYFLAAQEILGNLFRGGRVLRKFPGKDFASIMTLFQYPLGNFLETGRFHPAFPA